jgi:hypothetical protein
LDAKGIVRFAYKKIILSLTLLLFLLTASNCITAAFSSFAGAYTERVEINLDRSGDISGAGLIKLNGLDRLAGKYGSGGVSFSSRIGAYAGNGGNVQPAAVELTDCNSERFMGIDITRGTYFSEDAYKNGRNVAVISERLADRLFMNTDVIGNDVELLGEKFRIVGLYKGSGSIVSMLGSDGADRVYVPFTSLNNAHSLAIDTIYIHDKNLERESFREKATEDFLLQRMKVNPSLYRITDYYGMTAALRQLSDILSFLAALWCILILLKFAAAYIRKNAAYVKNCLKDTYVPEFIKSNMPYLCFFTAGVLLFAGLAACVYLFARPDLHIPARYIPQDNIFDIAFYADLVKSALYVSNSSWGYVPTILELYCNSINMLNIILLFCAIPAFFSAISGLKLLRLSDGAAGTFIKAIIVSCGSAAALSVLFSLAGGVGLAFPLKSPMIVLLTCLLVMINKNHHAFRFLNSLGGRPLTFLKAFENTRGSS